MILSDSDIRKAIEQGLFVIEPLPAEGQIDAASIDLHMGESLWVWDTDQIQKNPENRRVDVDRFGYKELSEQFLMEVPLEDSGQYVIEPGRVYLGSTHEKVALPVGSKLAARIEGKSSLARLGLSVHITAPTIHCGSGLGIITLEMVNQGPFLLAVTPGVSRICQLILEEVSSVPEKRTGRTFMDQQTPKG